MKPQERYDWIENYLRALPRNHWVDVLNRDFVDEYVEATGVKYRGTVYGADKCPQLGRDLSTMHKAMILNRSTSGLEGMAGLGFPRWVYTYTLGVS